MKSSSRTGAYPGMFKIDIQGDGNILAIDNIGGESDSSGTAGTYTNLTQEYNR